MMLLDIADRWRELAMFPAGFDVAAAAGVWDQVTASRFRRAKGSRSRTTRAWGTASRSRQHSQQVLCSIATGERVCRSAGEESI
jgi:hypothetical protein